MGTIVGLLPGLGPINGVAILLPLAFALHLPAESALILLATVYIGCEYGGRILHIAQRPRRCGGDHDGAGRLPNGAARERRRSAVDFRSQLIFRFINRYRRHHSVRPFTGAMVAGLRSGGIFRLNGFAIACLGSMMAQNPLKSFLAALIGLGLATVGVDITPGFIALQLTAFIFPTAYSLSSW